MGIYDRPYYRESNSPDLSPSWDQRSAVSLLIIACVVVFLANFILTPRDNLLSTWLSLRDGEWQEPWMLWRTFTYGFVHSPLSYAHILFNMFNLWMLGRAVEEHYGRSEFFRIYSIALIVCGVGWLLVRLLVGDRGIVCGASGAVCCITMLYVLNYPRATLLLFGVLPIQAWMLGVLMIVTNVLNQSPGLSFGGQAAPRVAFDVHLIGIGFAFAYFYGGWNFQALASPGDIWRALKKRLTGPKLRAYRPSEQDESFDESEADRILDKIHQHGQDSLTKKERKFLTEYSRQVRRKREHSDH
jgi:membrane associated rhomboid family serine protease